MTKTITIDYVVPMVFPNDPLWLRDLNRADPQRSFDAARYRSWGTEEMLIQCIRKFMPWVNNIFILLARESQVQEWMIDQTDIKLVFHRDFMPEECLPTFNSRAIEMFLHRIPGLSEHFLYANDDMIPLAPLKQEDFFKYGFPCQQMQTKDYPTQPNNFQQACMCGINFVGEEFGLKFTDKWLKGGHSIAPILKSVCQHLWQRDAERIMKSITPFREVYNFNQYIYSWCQHFSGLYYDHAPARCLTSVKTHTPEEMAAEIMNPDNQIVCINDNECQTSIKRYSELVCDAINRRMQL